jgi:DNA-binding Lrp family transcriptional regulator
MHLHLDEMDISGTKSLLYDERKFLRQISKKNGITTSTVNTRFERLMNLEFNKGLVSFFDFSKENNDQEEIIQIQSIYESSLKNDNSIFKKELDKIKNKITNGLAINIV